MCSVVCMSRAKKRVVNIELYEDAVKVFGSGTFELKDVIKEIARSYTLEYKFVEGENVWVVTGSREKLTKFVEDLQVEAGNRGLEVNIEIKDKHVTPKIIYEESLLEKLVEIGFDVKTVGVLYGAPLLGKTRLALRLARELNRQMGLTPRFIVTEPNYLQKYKGKALIDYVVEEFGRDSVVFCSNVHEVIYNVEKKIDKNCFIVLDSVGAISKMLSLEYYKRGGFEPLALAPRVIPLVNAIVQLVAQKTLEKEATALIIAHEQRVIGRGGEGGGLWYGEDGKPSFGGRALHDCTYVWRMLPTNDPKTRIIRCVLHRLDPTVERKEVTVKIL